MGDKIKSNMKLKRLSGDVNWEEYGGTWISKKLNNGDWDYWLVVSFTNLEEVTGEDLSSYKENKYMAEVHAVSPEAVGEEKVKKVMRDEFPEHDVGSLRDEEIVCALYEYGITAPLWRGYGRSATRLMKEARDKIPMLITLFGFYMDTPKNMMGSTGWDFISGRILSPKSDGE
jgi:hypothetical protein